MSFFSELIRRNVFRVGVAYAVACWLMVQIAGLVLDNINAPEWVMQVFMLALAVGFPIAMIIAWVFEVTPDGVRLAKDVDRSQSITRHTGQQLNRGIVMILSVAIVFLLTERFRDEASLKPAAMVSDSISPEAVQKIERNVTGQLSLTPTTELAVIAALENPALKEQVITQLLQDSQYPDGNMGKAFNLMVLQEYDLALDCLEKAVEEGDANAIHMNRMDVYKPIHDNPRYQALLAKMSLRP